MEDNKIIDLFFERSDNAIAELSHKYGNICMKISKNILGSSQDAEECVNDALLAVWNKIPPEKPNPLAAFLYKVTRNISINKLKYNSAERRNSQYNVCLEELEECISDTSTVENEISSAELSKCLNEFLDSLDEENRMLFVRRYWFMDSYKDLSSLSGMKEGTVRTRIARIKKELKEFLTRKGVFL